MRIRRALIATLILYIASFVVGLSISYVFGLELAVGEELPTSFLIIQSALSLILGFGAGWWYFRSPGVSASALHGLMLGCFITAVSFGMDFLLFIPGIMSGYPLSELASFYTDLWFWVAIALLLVGTSAAGFLHTYSSGPRVDSVA